MSNLKQGEKTWGCWRVSMAANGFGWIQMHSDEKTLTKCVCAAWQQSSTKSSCHAFRCLCVSERMRDWNREQACLHQDSAQTLRVPGKRQQKQEYVDYITRSQSVRREPVISTAQVWVCSLNANSTASQPPVSLSAACRRQMIADNRFAKGSWSHRDQAVLLLCFFHAADSVCSLWSGFA